MKSVSCLFQYFYMQMPNSKIKELDALSAILKCVTYLGCMKFITI